MIPLAVVLALLGAVLVLAVFLTELEHFGWATVTLVVTCIAAQWLHVANILEYVANNGPQILLYTLGYLAVGILWSFIKWFAFLIAFREKFQNYKLTFYKSRNIPIGLPLNQEQTLEFSRGYPERFHGNALNTKPKARDNQSRIVAWMCLWPLSFVGTLLNDPVKKFFQFVFNQIHDAYQKMSDRIFRNDQELK